MVVQLHAFLTSVAVHVDEHPVTPVTQEPEQIPEPAWTRQFTVKEENDPVRAKNRNPVHQLLGKPLY